MYHLFGAQTLVQNLISFSTRRGDAPEREASRLKAAYQAQLAGLQPSVPVFEGLEAALVRDREHIARLAKVFEADTILTDMRVDLAPSSITDAELDEQYSRFQDGVASLAKMDPLLASVFNLFTTACFSCRSSQAGGGTTSGAIGIVWIDSRPNWNVQDYMEFCVHELTHTLLFVDERVHKHFFSIFKVGAPETYAHSAILRRQRPLDKVIHAMVVATEVLAFRQKHGLLANKTALHPSSERMFAGVRASLQSLRDHATLKDLCPERVFELMDRCEDKLKLIEVDMEAIRAKNCA